MHWLVKSDPDEYSASDLERDGTTAWTGVRNALAQQHLKAMQRSDEVFVYHSGKDKAIVAIARVARAAYPDSTDDAGKAVAVDLTFDRWLDQPVKLADIKADPFFEEFELVRMSRLSVIPVTTQVWTRLGRMSGAQKREWADGR